MIYIVGSGPAGVSAAYALVKQGLAVTMLDIGVALEADREQVVDELFDTESPDWKPEHIGKLRENLKATLKGIPLKRVYGSDFPHRNEGQTGPTQQVGVGNPLTSPALGGFSNVWGSQFMPNMDSDMENWPVSFADLAPHYKAVLDFVPLSAQDDDLSAHVPLLTDKYVPLTPSKQADTFTKTLTRHRDALRAEGFVSGMSRLAVQAAPTENNKRGCVYCGLCMHGCPYKLIYNSAYSLQDLRRFPHFRYMPGVVVEKLVESESGVEIIARAHPSGEAKTFHAKRVYLACGAVASTRIVMESLGWYDKDVIIRDSVRFLLPMLHFDSAGNVFKQAMHTLGQVNTLVFDKKLSPYSMHLQFYMYNDHFEATMKSVFGPLFPAARPFLPLLFGRLSVILGFLHSDDSPHLTARLEKATGETRDKFIISAVANEKTRPLVEKIAHKLWKNRNRFRAVPMTPAMKVMEPGNGYHYGASFPMSDTPSGVQSDILGRVGGMQRVHVVDGAVLPAVTSTTFTFTIMANAHRIASHARELEGRLPGFAGEKANANETAKPNPSSVFATAAR